MLGFEWQRVISTLRCRREREVFNSKNMSLKKLYRGTYRTTMAVLNFPPELDLGKVETRMVAVDEKVAAERKIIFELSHELLMQG